MMDDSLIGRRFRLKRHIGYMDDINPHHPYEQWAQRHAPLFRDQVGEVVGISPAGEHGAGPHDQDTVVLRFQHHDLVIPPPTDAARAHAAGPPGPLPEDHRIFHPTDPEHVETDRVRHWSCTPDQLDEWFDEVSDHGR